MILAHFPVFGCFQKSKKTARLKRERLFFIKFSIKMPEFNRFPQKAYALGLRMLACAVPTFERAIYRPFECCIISLDYVQYLYSTTTSQLVFVFILRK